MPDQYTFNVAINLEANETKKNTIRDWLVTKLTEHRQNGNILSASVSIRKIVIPEVVELAPL